MMPTTKPIVTESFRPRLLALVVALATLSFRPRLLALVVALAALVSPGAAAAEKVAVQPGTIHYQNIQSAIQFLRDHGAGAAADEIQKTLDDGKLYVDSDLAENAETSAANNVSLNPNIAGNNLPFNRDQAWDPERDFQRIVELARTLYHENIHANHQSYAYWWFSTVTPGDDKESDAWRKTLHAIEDWITVERDELDLWYRSSMAPGDHLTALQKINAKISILTQYFGDYRGNDYFGKDDGGWATSTTNYWTYERDTYITPQIQRLEAAAQAAAQPQQPQQQVQPAQPQQQTQAGQPQPTSDPAADPEPEPAPQPDPVVCDPCREIADQVSEARDEVRDRTQEVADLKDELSRTQAEIDALDKQIKMWERQLQQTAGTGGSSYDPATGTTIEAYDQGDGTVRITTTYRNGTVETRSRPSNTHRAETRAKLDAARTRAATLRGQATDLEGRIAAAEGAARRAALELARLLQALADCIAEKCTDQDADDIIGSLDLPFEILDALAEPGAFNPASGLPNPAIQKMIIDWAESSFGSWLFGAVAPAPPDLMAALLPQSPLRARSGIGPASPRSIPWWPLLLGPGPGAGFQPPPARLAPTPFAPAPLAEAVSTIVARGRTLIVMPMDGIELPPALQEGSAVKIFLTNLGNSTGEAFEAQIFNTGKAPVRLSMDSLVVEPLTDEATHQLQSLLQAQLGQLAGGNPLTARLNAYCLEFLRQPPSPGTMFQIAGGELQQQFAPMGGILAASRRLQQAGMLNPDSNPAGYFHSIRQWAMWTVEQQLDLPRFADALVAHTRRILESQGGSLPDGSETVLREAAPNRWNDIQQVLALASGR